MIQTKIVINPQYESFSTFIKSIPDIYNKEGEILYDERNKVKRFLKNNIFFVVKRYKKPLFFQRVDYTFIRPSKAKRAYLFALRLKEFQINTPEAVAYIEIKKTGLFYTGYFISLNCGDSDTRILRKDSFDKKIAGGLASFLADMHKKGFLHGDLNLSNILYHQETNGCYNFTVIDINRSKFKTNPSREECLSNMKRLTHQKNLLKYIIQQYAQIRGWNPDKCISEIMKILKKFERKKYIIHFIKMGK